MIDDDDLADLRAERDANRAYQRQLLAHPDPLDPDHPGLPGGDDDEPAVAADLAYNDLKATGELQSREADRALAEQVKWGAP